MRLFVIKNFVIICLFCFLFKFFAFLYRIAKIAEPTKNSVEIPNIIPADFAFELLLQLLEDIAEYGVKEIYAHNMRFDYCTLQNTQRWLTKSKYRYFFPKRVEICDTLKMARQVLKDSKMYRVWCEQNGYITKNNQCRFSAEVLYKYITGNDDFIESHTGLEDVMIEKDILAYCYSRHKKMVRQLWQ